MTDTEAARQQGVEPRAGHGSSGAARAASPTPEERAARGKAERFAVSRSTLAGWEAPSGRRSPVELLEEQARSRVPELVPIRYGRMLVSPLTFFRGSASVMASDLAGTPTTGLHAQLCGDAHLSNFGGYAAPDRRLVFSINDFDETLPGPFEWDVKRLVASFAVAGRDRGFDTKQRQSVNLAAARSYREAIRSFAGMRNLDVWYARLDVEDIQRRFVQEASSAAATQLRNTVAKARTRNSLRAFAKLTETVNGQVRIVSDPPVVVPIDEVFDEYTAEQIGSALQSLIHAYSQTLPADCRHLLQRYRYVHAARKVVGVGSVGTRAWIVLFVGRDDSDPLFLQAKEAEASVLEPFLGKSRFTNHGQRVVEGQRLMQSASDIMLGWIHGSGTDAVERDFYLRQLWDEKGSAQVETMTPRTMQFYAQICGWTLARAHARSGDAIAIGSYLGSGEVFDGALASFAERYADQNERDHRALVDAVNTGRVKAETGV